MDVLEKIYNYKPLCEIENIFKLYIICEGSVNTAKFLNENGKRLKSTRGSRKYISSDVTKIIMDEENFEIINEMLLHVVRGMSTRKSRYQKWTNRVIDLCYEYHNKKSGVLNG